MPRQTPSDPDAPKRPKSTPARAATPAAKRASAASKRAAPSDKRAAPSAKRATAKRSPAAKNAPAKRSPGAKRAASPARPATPKRPAASKHPAAPARGVATPDEPFDEPLSETLEAPPEAAGGGVATAPPAEDAPSTWTAWGAPAAHEDPEPSVAAAASAAGPDRYPGELIVAGFAALLVLATFLPWYSSSASSSVDASGFATGTWGALATFFGLGSLATIALRRFAGVTISLPFEEPLVHEAVGWITVIGAVLKARIKPGLGGYPASFTQIEWGVWLAIVAGVGLAFFAGRMSPGSSILPQPGWHRGRAGKIGIAVLALMLGAGSAFAFVNDAPKSTLATGGANISPGDPQKLPQATKGTVPACGKRLPVVKGITVKSGVEQKGQFTTCLVIYETTLTLDKAATAFVGALRKGGWSVSSMQEADLYKIFRLTKPQCGQVYFVRGQQGKTSVNAQLLPCKLPTPKP